MFKSLLIDFVLLSGEARHDDYDESNRWVVWNENDGRYCLDVFSQRDRRNGGRCSKRVDNSISSLSSSKSCHPRQIDSANQRCVNEVCRPFFVAVVATEGPASSCAVRSNTNNKGASLALALRAPSIPVLRLRLS